MMRCVEVQCAGLLVDLNSTISFDRVQAVRECAETSGCVPKAPDASNSSLALPHTKAQAIATAKQYLANKTPITPGQCDHYVAVFYGLAHSGWASAWAQWLGTPASKKSASCSAGDLVFYQKGKYGHVALCSDQAGMIYTTDLPLKGYIGHVAIDQPTKVWGEVLAGYTEPYFPNV
jgi:hypothetical protein